MRSTIKKGKRILGIILTACMLMNLAGCGEEVIISEDHVEENCRNTNMNAVMKTDKGFYYSQKGELSLHYYDTVNKKNMFLCNKPECRHDGNEFCVATSDKYQVMHTLLYSGSLYINVIEETETSYEFKVLKASLDGSSLSEVVTYHSVGNTGVFPDTGDKMIIHRNKAFLPYTVYNAENDEVGYNGVAIYDMDTKEVTYLGEKEQSFDLQYGRFYGYGDYMYYSTSEKYRMELHRYCYTDGTTEKLGVKNFKGAYAIYDENTIFYKAINESFFVYNMETGENTHISVDDLGSVMLYTDEKDGLSQGYGVGFKLADVLSDGEYVYVSFNYSFHGNYLPNSSSAMGIVFDKAIIGVLDKEGQEVNRIYLNTTDLLGYSDYFTLHFMGDTVYMQTPSMMYECSKESFIAGKPDFKEVYPIDIKMWSMKEHQEK